jgi:NAD(P)-dependent dehydrogenase (short-subunit alcohol dehydrogenase family)
MARMADKTALITGGAGGIGAATARLFAREGADVVITDIEDGAGEQLAAEITAAGGRAAYLHHDVSQEADWERVTSDAVRLYGRLNVVVNNAGIAPTGEPIENLSLDAWRHVVSINLDGAFLGVKHGIRTIKHHGRGSIVNVSSIMGLVGVPRQADYGAAKGGVTLLTMNAALECIEMGYDIRVNSVHPSFTDTKIVRDALATRKAAAAIRDDDGVLEAMACWPTGEAPPRSDPVAQLTALLPSQRLGRPEEIASMILFLASDESTFANGAQFTVDGGYTAR